MGTRTGRVIARVCAAGLVATIVGAAVALWGIGRTESATRNGLDVAVEALAAVDATLVALDAVVGRLDDSIVAAAVGIDAVGRLVETVADNTDVVADLAVGEASPTVEGITGSVETLITAASAIEAVLDQVERLPGVDDLDVPFASSLREIRDGLEEVPTTLAALADALTASTGDLEDIGAALADAAATAREVAAEALRWPALVDDARLVASDAAERLDATRDRVTLNAWLTRLGVVATAVAVACANLAGIALGRARDDDARAGATARSASA